MLACLFVNHRTASYPLSKISAHLAKTRALVLVSVAVTRTSLVSRARTIAYHPAYHVAHAATTHIAPPPAPIAAFVAIARRRPAPLVVVIRIIVSLVAPSRRRNLVPRASTPRASRVDVHRVGVVLARIPRPARHRPSSSSSSSSRSSSGRVVCVFPHTVYTYTNDTSSHDSLHEGVIDPPARGSKSPSHHQSLARLRRARATSRDREDRNAGFDRRRRSRATDARAIGDRGREDGRGRRRVSSNRGQRRVERGTRDAGRGTRTMADAEMRAVDAEENDVDELARAMTDAAEKADQERAVGDVDAKGDEGEATKTETEEGDDGDDEFEEAMRALGDTDDEEDGDVMEVESGEVDEGEDGERARKRGRRSTEGDRAAAEASEGAGKGSDEPDELPRRTKVLISGNARTKENFVGSKGVVKKSADLGGWHWLVLATGGQVRVQRDALTVLALPEDANEDDEEDEDEDDEDDDEKSNMKTRLRRPMRIPGNGPPSQAAAAAMKRLQERRRSARPNCQSNFDRLTITTLQKYKKVYSLPPSEADDNKNALVHEVGKHFMSQKLDEQKVLQQFMCSVADTTQI